MEQRNLGNTGFRVSAIGHGLWGMSDWTGSDDAESFSALRLSVESGCNFFDSAYAYGKGHSDLLLGRIAATYRNRPLELASKIPPADWHWPSPEGASLHDIFPRAHVVDYAEKIMEAFGRPIDLLQFHVWEDSWAHDHEWQDTIEDLKENGVIRAFGISINRWQPENAIAAIETGLIESVQVIYNIFDQAPEDELFPACRKHNVGVIARVPLDEGSLTGKLTPDTKFPKDDWRSRYFSPENLKETVARVDALKEDLPEDMSLPEAAIRFILSEKTVSTLIPGMRKPDHVAENIAFAEKGPLPPALLSKLRAHRWDRSRSKPH